MVISVLWLQAFIFTGLWVVPKTFRVSSLLCHNWLSDPLAVSLERRSVDVAPPMTDVLDHLEGVVVNG